MISFCLGYQLLFPIVTDNFTIIESQTIAAAQSIASKVAASNTKIFQIKISEHSAASYLEQMIITALSKDNLLSADSSNPNLVCSIVHNNVYYNKLSNCKDSLIREVKTDLSYSLAKHSQVILRSNELIIFADTVAISEIEWLQRSEMPFAKSPLPPSETSWISELITPAIVLGASILSVVLLFSVRSK